MSKQQLLIIIFLLALAMMLGSLYIENFWDPIKNLMYGVLFPWEWWYAPCTLCWYERICMYPIVAIMMVYYWKPQKDISYYILPFAAIGLLFCVYHSFLQRGRIPAPTICTANAPCDYPVINYFGWMNLPFFGMLCNTLILIASFLIQKKHGK